MGNHDTYTGEVAEEATGNFRTVGWFGIDDLMMVVFLDTSFGVFGDAQIKELRDILETNRRKFGYCAVVSHYSFSYLGSMAFVDFNETARVERLFRHYNVNLSLCGHIHFFEYIGRKYVDSKDGKMKYVHHFSGDYFIRKNRCQVIRMKFTPRKEMIVERVEIDSKGRAGMLHIQEQFFNRFDKTEPRGLLIPNEMEENSLLEGSFRTFFDLEEGEDEGEVDEEPKLRVILERGSRVRMVSVINKNQVTRREYSGTVTGKINRKACYFRIRNSDPFPGWCYYFFRKDDRARLLCLHSNRGSYLNRFRLVPGTGCRKHGVITGEYCDIKVSGESRVVLEVQETEEDAMMRRRIKIMRESSEFMEMRNFVQINDLCFMCDKFECYGGESGTQMVFIWEDSSQSYVTLLFEENGKHGKWGYNKEGLENEYSVEMKKEDL